MPQHFTRPDGDRCEAITQWGKRRCPKPRLPDDTLCVQHRRLAVERTTREPTESDQIDPRIAERMRSVLAMDDE